MEDVNKLFKTVNSLFESDNEVTRSLNERGNNKYLKDIPNPDGEKWDSYDDDKIDDRGIKSSRRDRRDENPGMERFLYDVIKHLEPTGYHFIIDVPKSGYRSRYNDGYIKLTDGSDTIKIARYKIKIDENDNISAVVEPVTGWDRSSKIDSIFNKQADIQTIAKQLASEKGVKFDDAFMLDNAAEIKDRFNNQKTNGTLEELVSKIEKQFNKLPKGKLLSYMESVKIEGTELVEGFNETCPNWLKPYLKGRNKDKYYAVSFDDSTNFETVPTNKIKGKGGLTDVAKECWDNGEELFVRTQYGVYRFFNNRWRSVKDENITRSSEEMADSVIAAVKTTNKKATGEKNQQIKSGRAEAKKGSVERNREDAGHWEYDKSGYKIDPDKYKNMLRDINQKKLASSSLVNELNKDNFVNRFNELGAKAAKFIGDNLSISYNDTDDWRGFNTKIIDQVQTVAKETKKAIMELIDRVEYAKTGNYGSSYYHSKPDITDVEGWLKAQADKVETKLQDFEKLISKAEEVVESVKIIKGKTLVEYNEADLSKGKALKESQLKEGWLDAQNKVEHVIEEVLHDDCFQDEEQAASFLEGIIQFIRDFADEHNLAMDASYYNESKNCSDCDNDLKKDDKILNEDPADHEELEKAIASEIQAAMENKNLDSTNIDEVNNFLEDFISEEILSYMESTGEELIWYIEEDPETKWKVTVSHA